MTDKPAKLTYEDLKQKFSKKDLAEYDRLCLAFVKLRAEKNNIELWQELVESEHPSELKETLRKINKLRSKYDLIPPLEPFFYVWKDGFREDGSYIYQQVSW